jgi:prepilin signal peptidase PulO-like enzyme (type II secretory pathway)
MKILMFILGTILASSITCLSFRLDRKITLNGFSMCDNCGHKISPFKLIPIIGWCISGGQCLYCESKISIRYPFFELLFGFLFYFVGDFRILLVACILLFLSEQDLFNQTASTYLIYPLFLLFIWNINLEQGINFIFFWIILTLVSDFMNWMGDGDIPIILLFICILSADFFAIQIMVTCLLTVAYMLIKKIPRVPFIPFLLVGFILCQIVFQFV